MLFAFLHLFLPNLGGSAHILHLFSSNLIRDKIQFNPSKIQFNLSKVLFNPSEILFNLSKIHFKTNKIQINPTGTLDILSISLIFISI